MGTKIEIEEVLRALNKFLDIDWSKVSLFELSELSIPLREFNLALRAPPLSITNAGTLRSKREDLIASNVIRYNEKRKMMIVDLSAMKGLVPEFASVRCLETHTHGAHTDGKVDA